MAKTIKYLSITIITILLFLTTVISIVPPQHIAYIDKVLTDRINQKAPGIEIKELETKIAFNLRDLAIDLHVTEFAATVSKTYFKLPSLTLQLDLKSLITKDRKHLIKQIVFNEHQANVKHQTFESFDNNRLKDFIKLMKKSRYLLQNLDFKIPKFKLFISSDHDKNEEIDFQDIDLKFLNNTKELAIKLSMNVKFNDVSFDLNSDIKSQDNSSLSINSDMNNFTNNASKFLADKFAIEVIYEPNFDIQFKSIINNIEELGNITFTFQQKTPTKIHIPKYLNNEIGLEKLNGELHCQNFCQQLDIAKLHAEFDGNVVVNGAIKHNHSNNVSLSFTNLSTKTVLANWQPKLLPKLKQWLDKNIISGNINKFFYTQKSLNNKNDNTFNIILDNAILTYAENSPTILTKSAKVDIKNNQLTVNIGQSSFNQSIITHLSAEISDLLSKNLVMHFTAGVKGPLEDQLALTHFNEKDISLEGEADTSVSFQVPLKNNFSWKDLNLDFSAYLNNIKMTNKLNPKYFLEKSTLKAVFTDNILKITGEGKINNQLHTNIFFKHNFMHPKHQYELKFTTEDNAKNYTAAEIPFAEYFKNHIETSFDIINNKVNNIIIDLTQTSLDIDILGIQKKPGIPTHLFLELEYSKNKLVKISKFIIKSKQQNFNGSIDVLNGKIHHISGNLIQENGDLVVINCKLHDEEINLSIQGHKLDLNGLDIIKTLQTLNTQKGYKKGGFKLDSNISTIILNQNITLDNTELYITNQKNDAAIIKVKGLLNNKEPFIFYYSFPVLSVVTNNAGDFLKAVAITNKISNGNLEIKGKFNEKNMFDGSLRMENFNVAGTPTLMNFLTISTPISTLKTIGSNKTIKFSNLECPFAFKDNKISFTECKASNKAAAYKIDGSIKTDSGKIDARGIMVPKNILNELSNKFPVLDVLSGNKGEGILMSTLFDVEGNINDDIKVNANYLSHFTPGFLRNIFKKPLKEIPDDIKE